MQCLPHGTRLSDHLQPVVCTVYLNDIPLCHRNPARVARPSLPHAVHPVLGKEVVWFTRLGTSVAYMHDMHARSIGISFAKPPMKCEQAF